MIKILILLTTLFSNPADTSTFVSPAQIIEKAKSLESENNYKGAIDLYLTISENDTSYLEAMSELMSAYNALDDYDKTIAIGNGVKDLPSDFRNDIYISLGNAYLDKGDFESSMKIYNEGLILFPFSHVLMYNLGLAYHRQERFEEAIDCFQKSVKINPFYSSNHVMLGYISMLQGHRTKSLLSYLTYLAINPDNNSILVFLENMVNNAVRKEGSVDAFLDNSQFDYYDDLIRSKAALDSRFVRTVDFNVSIVKQSELLFSKLKYKPDTEDFWMDFYVPFYTDLESKGLSTAFIYFILKSSNNEEVASWLEKHEDEKTAWVNLANSFLKENRTNKKMEIHGLTDTYSCWYFNNNSLSAIGNQIDDDTRIGQWLFYSSNGQLNAEGGYNKSGEKIGTWKYYHNNGILSRIEEFDEKGNYIKPAAYYHEDGAMSIIAHYSGVELDSLVEYYYDCGQIKERHPYQNGEKTGKGNLYFETGEKYVDYELNQGELDKNYIYYFKNGQISNKYTYENGNLNGPFQSYYIDGQENEIGQYAMDSLDGDWVGYHPNGVMSYKGTLSNGKRTGQWNYYYSNGNLSEDYTYDDAGELDGICNKYTRNGTLHEATEYAHGLCIGYTYYDTAGNVTSSAKDESGNMDFESHYPSGEILLKSKLVDGKLNGEYISYFLNGNVYQKGNMVDDDYDGNYLEYFQNGALYATCNYSNGNLDGYYRSYFKNGNPNQEGWYVKDKSEQQWILYNPDGSKKQELYYINGKLHGWTNNFASENKIHRAFKYDMGKLVALRQYDTLGNVYHKADINSGTGWRAMLTIAGDTTFKAHTSCGYYDDDIYNFYPNGKVESHYPFENSLYEGKYEAFYENGKIETLGYYKNDQRNGSWKWYYDNGQLESDYIYLRGKVSDHLKRYYYNGELESDCVYNEGDNQGPCDYYDLNGNLQLTRIYDEDIMIGYLDNKTKDTIAFVQKGEFELKSYFPNGKTAVTQGFKNGLQEGPVVYYNINGTKSETINYQSGDRHGKWNRYYTNGKIQLEKNYVADLKNGDEIEYFENGKIKKITPYKNDEIDGMQIIYNTNGTIKSKTYYWNGYVY